MNKRLLIVDDDKDILDSLAILLEDQGYTISTTLKGEEVLEKALSFHPHLIILDLLLSGKDGCQIATQLKKNKKTQGIPIIMMSAHPNAGKNALACGADDYIAKPFDIDVFLAKIEGNTKK